MLDIALPPLDARSLLLLTLVLLGVAGLLVAEFAQRARAALIAKALASAGFVALGLVAADAAVRFDQLVVLGLVLAALGDVALALPGERAFQLGVGLFALGHLAYAAAACAAAGFGAPHPGAFAVCLPSALAYRLLYPRLGALRVLVGSYVLIISVMMVAAISLYAAHTAAQAGLFLLGATLFYLSDLSVARDRFVRAAFVNRAWGLPAYYAGQVCIALSTATP